jgi:hypothetical protein
MRLRKSLLFVSVVLATAGFTRNLHAEDTVEPQPSAASPQVDSTSTIATPGIEEPSESRFRWGISGAGGPMLGGYSGGAGGIDARFGMQMSQLLGLYAQPIVLVGAGVSADAHGASATGLALYGMGAMVDTTLANMFYLAGGPELLFGAVGTAAAGSNGSASASASTGPYFSLAGRAGFAFGSARPERRKAFTVGLDMHVVFAGSAAVLPMLGLGYEAF